MKKIVKLLTLSLIPLLICSCNGANNSTENSGAELVSSEVYSDNSKEVVSSTSKEEFQVELNQVYSSSSWDENINKMIEYVLEDKASFYIAPKYDHSDVCSMEPIVKANINEDNEEGLQTVKGIGSTVAKAIINYRTNNGPFKRIEDLKKVSGIGNATFEKIKDYVRLRS